MQSTICFGSSKAINTSDSEFAWSFFVRPEMSVKVISYDRFNWVKILKLFFEILLYLFGEDWFSFWDKFVHEFLVEVECFQTFLVIWISFFVFAANFIFYALLGAKNVLYVFFQIEWFLFFVEFIYVMVNLFLRRYCFSLWNVWLGFLVGEREKIRNIVWVRLWRLFWVGLKVGQSWFADLRYPGHSFWL